MKRNKFLIHFKFKAPLFVIFTVQYKFGYDYTIGDKYTKTFQTTKIDFVKESSKFIYSI